jgi:hypothetical protein
VKDIIRSAPGLPADYMMVRKSYLTELHRTGAQTMAVYRRLHEKYVSAARELNHFQQERQQMYWESRRRREAGEALTLEAECDTLRATLKATRAELDRVVSLAVEDRKRLQEFARGALLRAMGDLSEHHWCAGWLTGTEYFLWSAVEGNQPVMWGMDELRQGDIDNLRMLRELAGGWWVWEDGEAGEKFVGLDEMRQTAEAMRKIGDSARG